MATRLMLVDDEAQEMALRARVLTSLGCEILVASNPATAVEIAATRILDFAVVDYDMPGMNGCLLADRLKSVQPGLKIAIYSGAVTIPDGDIDGVDLFVSKTEGVFELLRRSSKLLGPERAG